jgi:hypothetical protein
MSKLKVGDIVSHRDGPGLLLLVLELFPLRPNRIRSAYIDPYTNRLVKGMIYWQPCNIVRRNPNSKAAIALRNAYALWKLDQ